METFLILVFLVGLILLIGGAVEDSTGTAFIGIVLMLITCITLVILVLTDNEKAVRLETKKPLVPELHIRQIDSAVIDTTYVYYIKDYKD